MVNVLRFDTVFSYAFRPFFALLGLYGIFIIPYWVLAWSGYLPLPAITRNPLVWHGHEMLFGFTGAAIAGFLLTAVANWTRRPPVSGFSLLLLCLSWLLARWAWLQPDAAWLPIAALFDLGFDAYLLMLFARELIAAGNRRNLKVAAVLLVYGLINAGVYYTLLTGRAGSVQWLLAALYLIVLLINIIGGRVIPMFTANWLRRALPACKQPPAFNRFDLTVVFITGAFMLAALAAVPGAGVLGIAAGLAQLLRLLRWRGWNTAREPLLWSLHIGYAWLGIGLLLNGVTLLGAIPLSASLHALTVGAVGGLIVAMSGRAALGHTGRPLTSHPLLSSTFVFINIAALTRVLAAFFPAAPGLLMVSGIAWWFAFTTYCIRYFPILLFPANALSQDGK